MKYPLVDPHFKNVDSIIKLPLPQYFFALVMLNLFRGAHQSGRIHCNGADEEHLCLEDRHVRSSTMRGCYSRSSLLVRVSSKVALMKQHIKYSGRAKIVLFPGKIFAQTVCTCAFICSFRFYYGGDGL